MKPRKANQNGNWVITLKWIWKGAWFN